MRRPPGSEDCLGPAHPVGLMPSNSKETISPERKPHGTPEVRSLPRPASSDRRESAAAIPPRPRFRRADRRAWFRRVLVRRAPFLGLGNDRLAGNVPGGRRRTHQAHQARHRRGLAALSPSLQRRAAHGAARLHDRRPRHVRFRSGRAGLRRAHARHRSDDAARPPGRGDRDHPPPVQGRARHRQERLVHHERRRAAIAAAAGRHAVRGGVADFAVGHDAGRQIRHRHHLARLDVDAGPDGAADAMGLCRGCREEGRHHRQPLRLARAAELAHRRDPRTGAARGRPRPDALAQ